MRYLDELKFGREIQSWLQHLPNGMSMNRMRLWVTCISAEKYQICVHRLSTAVSTWVVTSKRLGPPVLAVLIECNTCKGSRAHKMCWLSVCHLYVCRSLRCPEVWQPYGTVALIRLLGMWQSCTSSQIYLLGEDGTCGLHVVVSYYAVHHILLCFKTRCLETRTLMVSYMSYTFEKQLSVSKEENICSFLGEIHSSWRLPFVKVYGDFRDIVSCLQLNKLMELNTLNQL